MSGPSTLGTLLSQRLDAVMGQTLAKHAVLLDTRPGAAAQPVDRSQPPTPVNRRPPDSPLPGQGRASGSRTDATDTGGRIGREGAQSANRQSAEGNNVSARATLSAAARLILTLLADRPQSGPGQVSGRQPLWRPSPEMPGTRPSGGRTPLDTNPGTSQRPAAAGRPAAGPATAGAGATNAGNGSAPARGADGTAASQNARPIAGNNPQTGTPAPAAGANTGPAAQAAAQTAAPAPQAAPGAPTAAAPAPAPGSPATTAAAQTQATNAPANNGMPSAQVFVRALSQALQSSGLFYESHLSKVAFGKMPIDELMREPQARFAAARGGARLAQQAAGTSPGAQGAITHASTQSGMPPEAAALVRQQLETLAHSAIHWSGDAWADAPMEWEVADETHDVDPHARHWATRLSISLPNLGLVEARIQLSGMQLVMHLDAPDSAELLHAEGEVLRERYTAGGFTLSSFQVGDEPVAAPGTTHADAARPAPSDPIPPSATGDA